MSLTSQNCSYFYRMRAKILNASAGSGKTYQLAYQYIRNVIEQPHLYRHTLAVTFTNKATEEMKSRILSEIHRLAEGEAGAYRALLINELHLTTEEIAKRAREVRGRILHDYSRFSVLTIDTFFQRILRAFIKELNLDLNYNIELETETILAKSTDELIEAIAGDRALLKWLTHFVEERIEEGRKWDVREGILALGGEIFKEKNKATLAALRSREELQRIVADCSARSEKARNELQQMAVQAVEMITAAGGSIEDFPYKRTGFANWIYQLAEGQQTTYGARVTAAIADDAKWGKANTLSQQLRPALQPLLAAMRTHYDRSLRLWNTTALIKETYRSFALLGDLYDKVEQYCTREQLLFLSETKYLLSKFVCHNDTPFIYEKVGNRFDRFLIDEFQDTSVKEWENFLPLLQNALAQTEEQHNAVLLVGDIKQSIYRWRGSDWNILHREARKALGEEQTEVIHLKDNWRSLPTIVRFNNEAIRRVVEEDQTRLNRALDEAVTAQHIKPEVADSLRNTLSDAYREVAQEPRRADGNEGFIAISTYDEHPPFVERICRLLDAGFRPSDMMILVRTTREGVAVASELLDFKSRNRDPRYRFDVMTQEALIIGSAAVSRFILSTLRLALNPDESLARAQYNHYLDRPFDTPFRDEERLFFRSLRLLSPEEAFEQIVLHHALDDRPEETAYLQALHEQIIAFSANRVADLALFIAWWEEHGARKSLSVEQSTTTIEVTTIHKAKGLEKPVILIPYCCWELNPKSSGAISNIVWAEADEGEAAALGRFPIRFKQQMAASAFAAEYYREVVASHIDNINLFYVALTRAAESLHIFLPERNKEEVGTLLRRVITTDYDAGEVTIGSLTGCYREDATGEHFEFGTFAGPVTNRKQKEACETHLLTHYPTSEADLRLRLPSQRYFEEESEVELSPRNLGILMHRAFEQAIDEEAIDEAIEQMRRAGTLCDEEAVTLRRMVAQALTDERVRAWFDGTWEEVRTEQEIILPRNRQTRRPDRVLMRGTRAVVIDYKFGERDASKYRSQMREYCRLMSEMGYTEVEGYLWYVKLGKIEQVEC